MAQNRFTWLQATLCSLLLGASATAHADAMRCGTDLVADGDSTYEVRSLCGEPDAVRQRIEYRSVAVFVPRSCVEQRGRRVCGRVEHQLIPIVLDEWTYDFGSTSLIRYVTFEDGRLRDIATGDHGEK